MADQPDSDPGTQRWRGYAGTVSECGAQDGFENSSGTWRAGAHPLHPGQN